VEILHKLGCAIKRRVLAAGRVEAGKVCSAHFLIFALPAKKFLGE